MNIEGFIFGEAAPKDEFQKNIRIGLDKFTTSLRLLLNKGLKFSDNFDSYIGDITTSATPGVETAISHGLKRIPTGMIVLEKDKAAHIYLGGSGKSASVYNVKSDIASVTATLMIF